MILLYLPKILLAVGIVAMLPLLFRPQKKR